MKFYLSCLSVLFLIAVSCSKPAATESESSPADSIVTEPENDVDTTYHEPRGDMDDRESMMSEYSITNQGNYVSDPFEFSLDTTELKTLLGKGTVVQAIETESGEDELGAYSAYTYFIVTNPNAELKFYSYPGKHVAEIRTPALTLTYGIKVGMSRLEFLTAMGIEPDNDDVQVADAYIIRDDYGVARFYFLGNTLESVSVDYEEGD